MNKLLCLFIKYFSVKIEQLKCESKSGPLTVLRKKSVHGLEKVEKHLSKRPRISNTPVSFLSGVLKKSKR